MQIVIVILLWFYVAISTFGCSTYNITLYDCEFDNSEFKVDGSKDIKSGIDTTGEDLGNMIGTAVKTLSK